MEIRVSNIEAAKSLDELLDRVTNGGDTVVIERDGKPAARLVLANGKPAKTGTGADLVRLLKSMPKADDGWAKGVEEAKRLGSAPVIKRAEWE